MTQFSEKTRLLLEQAGWTEGRAIDPTPYVEALEEEGYTVFPPVVEFMRQFGGLRITYWYKESPSKYILHFDTTDITATQTANVNDDAALIKTPLCLIGEADDFLTPLTMDPIGRVYFRADAHIYLIGETGEAGIESFLGDDDSRLIEVWRYSEG